MGNVQKSRSIVLDHQQDWAFWGHSQLEQLFGWWWTGLYFLYPCFLYNFKGDHQGESGWAVPGEGPSCQGPLLLRFPDNAGKHSLWGILASHQCLYKGPHTASIPVRCHAHPQSLHWSHGRVGPPVDLRSTFNICRGIGCLHCNQRHFLLQILCLHLLAEKAWSYDWSHPLQQAHQPWQGHAHWLHLLAPQSPQAVPSSTCCRVDHCGGCQDWTGVLGR